MDQIEPVRLDTNLFNMAMQAKLHEQGQEELQRHHGVMEAHAEEVTSAQEVKSQAEALNHILINPDIPSLYKYQAAQKLYAIGTKGQGQQLPPANYIDRQSAWNAFLSSTVTNGTDAPETASLGQALAQIDPFAGKEMQAAIARQKGVEVTRGLSQLQYQATGQAGTPEMSQAINQSAQLQGKLGEAAFPGQLKSMQAKQVQEQVNQLKTDEAVATSGYNAFKKAVVPLFNVEAEESLRSALPAVSTGPLSKALSTTDRYDQAARKVGAYKTDDFKQMQDQLPQQMDQLTSQARSLREEARQAKLDVSGTTRPIEQIQAELQATQTALNIKSKELAYATTKSPQDLNVLKQAYAAHDATLDSMKQNILRLRGNQSLVAQSALNEKIAQDKFKNKQELDLAAAQAHYLKHKNLGATLEAYPNIRADQIREAEKDPNKPQVAIDMGEKASVVAAKQFMESTRTTYDQLKNAPAQLKNLAEAKALIPQAKGFMGPGGESLLEAAKFLNNRLGMSINTEGVKGAEELRSRIFFNVMDNLKKMDAQPSQMQQMIMMDSLGKLGTDPQALTHVLNAYEDSIRNKVDVHNTEVEGAMKQGTKFPYDPRIKLPKADRQEAASASPAHSSATTATGPGGKKLILKDGTWQPLN